MPETPTAPPKFSIETATAEVASPASRNAREKTMTVGTSFVRNIWYFATLSDKVKTGKTISKEMLGELILIGRDKDGKVFAMRDICPHQGVPLSAGSFDGCKLQCPYHGWRFDTSGVCTEIPDLAECNKMNVGAYKTPSFPCEEVQGCIWVYFGDAKDNLPEIPSAPLLDGGTFALTSTTLRLPNHFDYHVVALLDPAHVPYVHKQWWWSRGAHSIKEKVKTYVPCGTGWTMVKHKRPKQSFLLNFLGTDIETEIGFRLPAYRMEHIITGGKAVLSGITTLTPIDENTTEFTHITYWAAPFARLFAPLVRPFINWGVYSFVVQDGGIAILQAKGLRYKPNLIMTIRDSGTPSKWYFALKKEWNDSQDEGRPFVNPIEETILRWRT